MKNLNALLSLLLLSQMAFAQTYCVAGPTLSSDSEIGAVSLIGQTSSINYTQTCPGVIGLNNQTALQNADLVIGTNYSLTVVYGQCGPGSWVGMGTAYIDFNGDGVFDVSEAVGTMNATPVSQAGVTEVYNFTVPAGATPGITRMRVIQWETSGQTLPLNPCPSLVWGSVIDFGITILSGGPCTAPPIAGNTVASDSVICLNTPVSLSLSGASYGAGQTFQWQSSTDGVIFTNITAATQSNLSANPLLTTWYRCLLSCSGQSAASMPLKVTVQGAALSGVYTLNQALASSGTNFSSFTDFKVALGCGGVSGPVTLNVAPGTYAGPWSLSSWSGASYVNMLTIQADPALGGTVVVSHASAAAADGFVLSLSGVSHFAMSGITLSNSGVNISRNVEFFGTCEHIYFDSMTFNRPANAAASISTAALYEANAMIRNLEVTNSIFNNGYGPYFGFATTATGMGDSIRFANNTLNNINGYCFFMLAVRNLEIVGNTMNSNTSGLTYGIFASGNSAINEICRLVIRENDLRMSGPGTKYGFWLANYNPGTDGYNEIINNMVYIDASASNTVIGAYLSHIASTKFYHNSIMVGAGTVTSGAGLTLNQLTAGFSPINNDFRNNIIANFNPGYAVNMFSTSAISPNFFSALNNNLYYALGSAPLRYGNMNYANLSGWQSGTGYDSASLFDNPQFVGNGDLHLLAQSPAINTGLSGLGVLTDIDDDPRNCAVDIGADEYQSAGGTTTSSILNPVACDSYSAPDNQAYTQSGQYQAIITNAAGCDSIITINLTILSSSASIISELVCSAYVAPNGQVLTQSGQYQFTTTNAAGCDSVININLQFQEEVPQFCLVTADSASGNFNVLVWEKNYDLSLVDSFYVYRETGLNTFTKIGAVHVDSLSVFMDMSSNPNVTSYKYKLSIKDICGGISDLGKFHNSMHLQYFGWGNFQWSLYAIENESNPVFSYNFYRDDFGSGNYQLLQVIPGGNNSYTDINYQQFPNAAYRVEVVFSSGVSCSPSRSTYTKAYSNIYRLNPSDLDELLSPSPSFSVFPNPAKSQVTVRGDEIANSRVWSITLMDIAGRVLQSEQSAKDFAEVSIDLTRYSSGTYLIKIESDFGVYYHKLLKE